MLRYLILLLIFSFVICKFNLQKELKKLSKDHKSVKNAMNDIMKILKGTRYMYMIISNHFSHYSLFVNSSYSQLFRFNWFNWWIHNYKPPRRVRFPALLSSIFWPWSWQHAPSLGGSQEVSQCCQWCCRGWTFCCDWWWHGRTNICISPAAAGSPGHHVWVWLQTGR